MGWTQRLALYATQLYCASGESLARRGDINVDRTDRHINATVRLPLPVAIRSMRDTFGSISSYYRETRFGISWFACVR